MNTIILNGSPKGKQGNSEIFIQQFIKDMHSPCEVKYIYKEDPRTLTKYASSFDTIIMVLPLYIHSMPAGTMRFIECLEPTKKGDKKSIGFIVQCGFMETSQCKYLEAYFRALSKELNRMYLGTVTKGEAAATYMMPSSMTRKLFKRLSDLGKRYEETNAFDKEIVKKMKKPYVIKGSTLILLRFLTKTGVTNIGWHKMLKQNNAFDERLARPFINK